MSNSVVIAVPADGLAPSGARPFADTAITNFGFWKVDNHIKKTRVVWPAVSINNIQILEIMNENDYHLTAVIMTLGVYFHHISKYNPGHMN